MYSNQANNSLNLTRKRGRTVLFWASVLATLFLQAAPAAAAEPARKVASEDRHFLSGGKHPALILLHAVDGVEGPCAALYQDLGREYARKGYVILLVHYFDRTGREDKDREAYREMFVNYFTRKDRDPKAAAKIRKLFDDWAETVRDAVSFAGTRPEVDADRVGLVGFSLGASLALTAATRYDLKVAALVEFFGALPRELYAALQKLPPTLIFHGEADRIVPVEEAYLLAGVLCARKLQPEVEVYAGVEHMFYKDGKEL